MSHNYQADAEVLDDAMRGAGTNEAKLIAILGARSRHELYLIDLEYRKKFGKLLVDTIKSETSGNFGRTLVNIIQPPALTDAIYLYESMAGMGTNEVILNEILATRSGAELDAIKAAYIEKYHHGAEADIKGDTSGKYENLLISLLNAPRGKDREDMSKAAADAVTLHDIPTEISFTSIIGTHSEQYIQAVAAAYASKYGKTLVEAAKKEFSGNYEDLLVAVLTPRAEYLAEKAYKAMKGMGTDDDTLIRIITTRHGVDLPQIKQVFLHRYNKSLYDWVKSETSGDYRKIMLDVIGQ